MNGKRVNKIRQIVRLQQFVKKWRTLAISRDTSHPKSKQSSPFSYDSDEDCCRSPASSPPPDVPEGYLAVYVGGERRRFIIPTTYLSRPVFRTLLQKAEEEFGFDHKGGLTIPCEVSIFKHVLRMLERNDPAGQKLSLDEVMIFCSLEREYGSEAYSKILNSTRTLRPLL